MNVFFAFVPTAAPGEHHLRMEVARNAAVPERVLKARARTGRGATLYVGDIEPKELWSDRPQVVFTDADMTAFLLVWKRSPGEAAPRITDAPDELWSLTPRGAVVKEACQAPVRPALAVEPAAPTAFRAPVPVLDEDDAELLRPLPPRTVFLAPGEDGEDGEDVVVVREFVAPIRALCKACDVMPRADGRCGCS